MNLQPSTFGDCSAASRCFFPWTEPLLAQAARWLLERAEHDEQGCADLTKWICLVPGRRAQRLLLATIAHAAQECGQSFIPPMVLTPGLLTQNAQPRGEDSMGHDSLFAQLEEATAPLASKPERRFAWMHALRDARPDALATLSFERLARADVSVMELRGAAQLLLELEDDLAACLKDFSEVADAAEAMDAFHEGDRWRALGIVHRACEGALRRCGLESPHARAMRIRQSTEITLEGAAPESRLALIGIAELNELQRRILKRCNHSVHALVHGAEEDAQAFDDFGCPRVDVWLDRSLHVPKECIRVADTPDDQAQAALRCLAALAPTHSVAEITVGLADPALEPAMLRAGEWAEVHLHPAAGESLGRSLPARLLSLCADWIEEQRFVQCAALLRHPDFEACLRRLTRAHARSEGDREPIEDWITLLDDYFADHLQQRLTGEWLGDSRHRAGLATVYDRMASLLAPLTGSRRALSEWVQPIMHFLQNVYVHGADARIAQSALPALRALRDVFEGAAATAPDLQPIVSGADALRLLMADAQGEQLPGDVRSEQIEMLGWLELPLDPAPALIIMGVNDGALPETSIGHAFLPDGLRARLGLTTNDQRYARDACLLTGLMRSRASITLITGRRNALNDPLVPSRLLLAEGGEALLERVQLLFEDAPPPAHEPLGLARPAAQTRFMIPELPADLPVLEQMSVTSFKVFLQCPFRFALAKVLKLEAAERHEYELNAGAFGTLLHDVLCAFGMDEAVKNCECVQEIEQFVLDALSDFALERYGPQRSVALQVQLARMEQRLRGFAREQSQVRSAGWRIVHCEKKIESSPFPIHDEDAAPMLLKGKIDRLDQHEMDDRWLILDYKTGTDVSPHAHHAKGRTTCPKVDGNLRWIDLQLPLYEHLAKSLDIAGDISLGYFSLPKQSDRAKVNVAEWTDGHIAHAHALARNIIQQIRSGVFPRNDDNPPEYDTFARICQTNVYVSGDESDLDTGGAP